MTNLHDSSLKTSPKVRMPGFMQRTGCFVKVLVLVFMASLATAQLQSGASGQILITQPIDEGQLVTLKSNTRPEANAANDRGAVGDQFQIEHMLLHLRRSPASERALQNFIAALQTPGSPNFHHWITPQEFGDRFGLAKPDLATVTDWLQSHGFKVNVTYPNGMMIDFSGSAGQVREAFRTEIHRLEVDGQNGVGAPAIQNFTLTIGASQTITFQTSAPPTAGYGSNFTVVATGGGSGNQVVFSSSGVCSNVGGTYTMTSGTGTCSVIANQAGSIGYLPASQVTQTTTATLAVNTVTFTTNAPASAPYNSTFTVAATGGGSVNPVVFSGSGACTNLGATFTMTNGAGTCYVEAFQFSDSNYETATATETTVATLAPQVITFTTNAPASAAYGTSFFVAATGGRSQNPVVFSSAGACSNVGGNYAMTSGTGTCSVIANQQGAKPPYALHHYADAPTVIELTTATLATQSITFTTKAPASAAYGTSFTVAATATSGLPITYTSSEACSNSGALYTMTSGTGSCSVTASQPGNSNYSAANSVTESTTAAKLSQSISFTTNGPSAAVYGTSFAVAATATSGLLITYTSSGACSNSGTAYTMTSGTGSCSVIANQPGNSNYVAARQVTQSTSAQKAAASVSISNIPGNAVAGKSFWPTYTTNSNDTPSVSSSTSTTCTVSGSTVSFRAAGTCTLVAHTASTSNYSAGTGASQSFTIIAITLTSISPTSGLRGTSFQVTLNGTNLTGATAVVVSGSGVTVSNISSTATTVTATFTIATNATVSSRTVSVTTPIGNSNTVAFAVTGPTLTSIAPNTGLHGTTVAVTLTGTNLTGASSISVSGFGVQVTGLTVTSSTTVMANFVISSGTTLSNRSVTVTTPIGTTGAVTFTVQ